MAILNLVGNFLSNILLLRALSHVANADLIETLLVIMSYWLGLLILGTRWHCQRTRWHSQHLCATLFLNYTSSELLI